MTRLERTQKEIVRDLLIHRGATGVSAREAIYDLHITRLAAIVFDLKREGYRIRTEQKPGQTARYFLLSGARRPAAPVCECGHGYRAHMVGTRCYADVNEADPLAKFGPCSCQKYAEKKEVPE